MSQRTQGSSALVLGGDGFERRAVGKELGLLRVAIEHGKQGRAEVSSRSRGEGHPYVKIGFDSTVAQDGNFLSIDPQTNENWNVRKPEQKTRLESVQPVGRTEERCQAEKFNP